MLIRLELAVSGTKHTSVLSHLRRHYDARNATLTARLLLGAGAPLPARQHTCRPAAAAVDRWDRQTDGETDSGPCTVCKVK